MIGCCEKMVCACSDKLQALPLLLTRLTVGLVFAVSGFGKLNHLDQTIEFFSAIHIPFAHFMTPFTAAFELVCGVAVLAGFRARLAAIPLLIIILVAILTAKMGELKTIYDLFLLKDFLYFILIGWIFTQGSGPLSLDCVFSSSCRKES